MSSCLYECDVMHARFAPRTHRFVYRIFLFALDLDELPALHRRLPFFSVNRPNLYSFREADYLPTHEPVHNTDHVQPVCNLLGDKPRSLKQRVIDHLAGRGVDLTGGRVVLVTLPRIFGYLFHPVSFYFCYDRHGACVAALAEVTNTFREMKPYFLGPATRAEGAFRLRVPKHFYVSPFSDVDVEFDFMLRPPDARLAVQIDDHTGGQRTLTSTLTGPRRCSPGARLAWFTVIYPLLTLRIIALIHWHALRLWLKKVPWFAKAGRAAEQRDLYRPHTSLAPTKDAA
ncbi:MAG: DUF1365 domain-containing protein [Opitutaceae bacterium]|nr:DUF1365 domain-containing protein [Opitutaceae bacterium]